MGRLGLAFKTFFRILRDAAFAEQVLAGKGLPAPATELPAAPVTASAPVPPSKPASPERSEALTLLEAFQREARLIDFLQEDLSAYQDAQVGAAVREVHRGCCEVLARSFAIESVLAAEEGTPFEVTTETDAASVRLTGNVVATRPLNGTLVHSGWKATRCALPQWKGDERNALLIAPAEVEIA